jgi:hypothetical protein
MDDCLFHECMDIPDSSRSCDGFVQHMVARIEDSNSPVARCASGNLHPVRNRASRRRRSRKRPPRGAGTGGMEAKRSEDRMQSQAHAADTFPRRTQVHLQLALSVLDSHAAFEPDGPGESGGLQ